MLGLIKGWQDVGAMSILSLFLKAKNRGVIKEPRNVDFSLKSEPWTEQELADFRKTMQDIKAKNAKRKERSLRLTTKKGEPV